VVVTPPPTPAAVGKPCRRARQPPSRIGADASPDHQIGDPAGSGRIVQSVAFCAVGVWLLRAASHAVGDRVRAAGQRAAIDAGPAAATGNRSSGMSDNAIRAALDRHWAASDANHFDAEHDIYREDAVLEYPQSGERIRGRHNIQASRVAQPNAKRFTVRRIVGTGDLWVTEFVLTYDGRPSYTVSVMEFLDGRVARETQYFADPFEPGASRAQWVERIT
jgi:SnoaL-like domain